MTGPERSMTAAELLDTIEVQHLTLEPGDTLLFKAPQRLSMSEFETIRDHLQRVLPDVKVLVVDAGMDVSVLRAET